MKEVFERSQVGAIEAHARGNSWARIGLRKAEAFNVEFQVEQTLNFKTPLQNEIFNFYFAHYIIRKEGNNTHYLLNHPAGDTLKKIPLLKKLPAFLEKVYNEEEEAARILLAEAGDMSVTFEQIVKNSVNEELSRKFGVSVSEVEIVMDNDGAEGLKDIIKAFGSPNAIQRAANLLSSVFVEKKELSKEAFDSKVRKMLIEIKKRDFSTA